MHDELIPFFTYNDLYLKQIYRVNIIVTLPKLRQMGQSVSNWEIRERLKKMLNSIQLFDFKVLESSLEEVRFVAIVNTADDSINVVKSLDGITFRAVGFTEALLVRVTRGEVDFPTRTDWDRFFAGHREMDERNRGERPDTVYISGLPFEWFKSVVTNSYEETFKKIFEEYGAVICVDIPQCDPMRKEMDPELSGIRQSVWSFGEDTFFEAYIQFKEYAGFVRAMNALSGKVLVQKIAGELREAKIKVEFDKTAHLSVKKIRQRELKRAILERSKQRNKNYADDEKPSTSITEISGAQDSKENENKDGKLVVESKKRPRRAKSKSPEERNWRREETKEVEEKAKPKKSSKKELDGLKRQLIRAEKRRLAEMELNREQELRNRLKQKLTQKLSCTKKQRETGALALLNYIAKLHEARIRALQQSRMSVNDLASEYVKEKGLPDEEELREKLLRKKELCLRSRIAERALRLE